MKKGWTYKKLGEVCHIGIGRTPSRSDLSLWDKSKQTHNYWVSIADMGVTDNGYITDTKEYISDKAAENVQIIPKGTLLLSFKLTLGKTAIAGTNLYTNEAIANLPFISNEVNREFLSYYFQYFNWEKYSAGDEKVLGKALNKKKLEVLPIYYPILSEQQRIVENLDSAFAHIDELKANAEKQLREARVLFQKALTKALEPKEGWEKKTLKEICTISGDYGLSVSSKPFDGIRYLRITDITEWGGLHDEKVSANIENGKNQDELEEGDILFARTGATVGKTLVYKKEFGECLFAGYLIRYRLNKDIILPRYMYYMTHSKDYYDWVFINQEAAAQPNISAKKYNLFPVNYPPLSEQQQIVARLDSLSAHVRELEEVNKKFIAECDALKQALLRKVFE